MITFLSHCQRYLLITITICFAVGISSTQHFNSFAHTILYTVVSSLFATILLVINRNKASVFFLCFCIFFLGRLLVSFNQINDIAPIDIRNLVVDKQEVVITGTVKKMVQEDRETPKFLLDLSFARTATIDHFVKVSGVVLISLRDKWPKHILPGDSITIRAHLRKPTVANTPGVFNYRRFLAEKNIHVTGSVSSSLLIKKTSIPGHNLNFFHYIERIRTLVSRNLDNIESKEAAGIYKAVLLGDKSSIPDNIIEMFKNSGTLHILAISGLHMTVLSFFLYNLFYYSFRCSERLMLTVNIRKLSIFLCLPFLFIYTLLAGANTPVVRSFIMSIFVISALCTDRVKSPLTIVALAAFLILIANPSNLFQPSFQLSFGAVISIILITPQLLSIFKLEIPINKNPLLLKTFFKWVVTIIAVSTSATIGTAPILIYHFHQISTVTIPANLVIEPLICFWSLPLGFAAIPFMIIHPPIAEVIINIGSIGLDLAIKTSSCLSAFRFSTFWLPAPHFLVIVLYYVSLLHIFSPLSRTLKTTGLFFLCVALIAIIIPLTDFSGIFRNESRISFIDIGQGSSTLVELKGGRTILIDGGAVSAPGFNCGERILAPFLWHRGLGRIDDVIVTHADADHYNGLSSLFRKFKTRKLWLPHSGTNKPGYLGLIDQAVKNGVEVIYPNENIVFSDKNSNIRFISHPVNRDNHGRLSDNTGSSYNDKGLVIRLVTDGVSFLFPGDISAKKERELLISGIPINANILLSPHHGSSTSNSLPFLFQVKPDYLIVSSGDRDRKLFPSTGTLENARKTGATILTTTDNGTITVAVKNSSFRVTCFKHDNT